MSGLISAFLISVVPYWYQFVFFLSTKVFGFVLYGIANQGWVVLLGLFMAGMFNGAEVTLGFHYATDLSSKFTDAYLKRGDVIDDKDKKAVKLRNYFYAVHTGGYTLGFSIGTGISFSDTDIYRSTACMHK